MSRTHRAALRLAPLLALFVSCWVFSADPAKVLHVASPDIETLDPHQYDDDPSFQIIGAIFEGLYEWDYLADTPTLAPVTAAGPPQISADGLSWTVHIKPGIYFTDDPAFKGRPRELVARDFTYSITRWLDPNLRRGGAPQSTDLIVGARAVVDAARKSGRLDYDRPIEGLRALDRYTLQLKLTQANFPIAQAILNYFVCAREVVEAAHGDIRARPVGTGPYRLREWKRGSRLVLEANPKYRALVFPPSDDRARAGLEKSMYGRTLPQIGVVDVAFIEEDVTRLLEFERGNLDVVVLRAEVAARLLADNRLRPEYVARGIARHVFTEPFLFEVYFNMSDPAVGGMDNAHVALRRAIALAFDRRTLIDVVYAGQALPANQLVPPGVAGHDPQLPPPPSADPAAANALLDRFGYKARDAQGFRLAPDGKPLTLTLSLRTGAISREIATLWKKNLDAIGLRSDFHITPFQDVIKELEGGKFQMFWGGYGGTPFGYPMLWQLDGRQPQTVNVSRFRSPEVERLVDAFFASPDEAGRVAAARRAAEIAATYVPTMPTIFRQENDFVQPWVKGYSPMRFTNYWKYLDIDLARQHQAQR
ncbi:MAG TPA: ABC transporter substrate-binding protein [Casimicrobiaceae bacterium]|nr:ABC transporter substrate-binding protein [Casimicrobiaceae bacterium]